MAARQSYVVFDIVLEDSICSIYLYTIFATAQGADRILQQPTALLTPDRRKYSKRHVVTPCAPRLKRDPLWHVHDGVWAQLEGSRFGNGAFLPPFLAPLCAGKGTLVNL